MLWILAEPEKRPNAKAKLTGAACKDVDARKTCMAAPVSFSRWFAGTSLAETLRLPIFEASRTHRPITPAFAVPEVIAVSDYHSIRGQTREIGTLAE